MTSFVDTIIGKKDQVLENFFHYFIDNDTAPEVFSCISPHDFSPSLGRQLSAQFGKYSTDKLAEKVHIFVKKEGVVLRHFFSENSHRMPLFANNLNKITNNPAVSQKIVAHVTPPLRNDEDAESRSFDPKTYREFSQKSNRIIQQLKQVQDAAANMQASQDLGGHGGNYRMTVYDGNTPYHLFLKPLDRIEYNNYILLQQFPLSQFLIPIYGTVEISGNHYLVMQNVRKDQDGSEIKQLADLKLAGVPIDAPSDFNPICSQKEMKHTRGVEKSLFDFTQMNIGARNSPGFLHHMGLSAERILHYPASKKHLQQELMPLEIDALRELKKDLEELRAVLRQSPVALIGGSVILIKDAKGHVQPMLIDPAHIQVDPNYSSPNINPLYYSGDEYDYALQKQSNQIGMDALIDAVQESIEHQEGLTPEAFEVIGASQDPDMEILNISDFEIIQLEEDALNSFIDLFEKAPV